MSAVEVLGHALFRLGAPFFKRIHAQAILDALSDAGYAVVELASAEKVEDYGLSAIPEAQAMAGLAVSEETDTGVRFRTVAETRNYAAALLAAAAAAETS